MPELTVPASLRSLEILNEFVRVHAEAAQFSGDRIREVELALEEALVNVFRYAYPGEGGDVTVICRVEDGRMVVVICDRGIPFNLLDVPGPDISADVEERRVGGLGVYLIRRMADDVRYRRDGDRNLLELTFARERGGAV